MGISRRSGMADEFGCGGPSDWPRQAPTAYGTQAPLQRRAIQGRIGDDERGDDVQAGRDARFAIQAATVERLEELISTSYITNGGLPRQCRRFDLPRTTSL